MWYTMRYRLRLIKGSVRHRKPFLKNTYRPIFLHFRVSRRPQSSQKDSFFNQFIILIVLTVSTYCNSFLMSNQFKSSIRDKMHKWNGQVSSWDWKNPISLQLTFTFEPLTHQSPQHFSTMVTEGWCSVRMNKKGMGPDLKVFKCSRSCNKEIIQKINKIINITNMLLYMVLHRTKQTSFWSLWWWTLNFMLVIVLYSEDKWLMIYHHTTMTPRKE